MQTWNLAGRVAAITGAAAGIGRAVALDLARHGATIAAADRDGEGLERLADDLRRIQPSNQVSRHDTHTTRVVDVADRQAVFAWAEEVDSHHGHAEIVVNNAGVAVVDRVSDLDENDFGWLMDINFWGVVHGTQAFLGLLRRAERAQIVNISSVMGLVSAPTQGAYAASKFAVRGFTEALRQELLIEGVPIGVTCVYPGAVATDILKNARLGRLERYFGGNEAIHERLQRAARTTPELAARRICDAIAHNRPRVLIGPDAWLLDRLQRLMPERYQELFAFLARRFG